MLVRLLRLLLYILGCAQCSVLNDAWLVSRVRLGLGCCYTPQSTLHVWCGTWVGGIETVLAGLARLMTGWLYAVVVRWFEIDCNRDSDL